MMQSLIFVLLAVAGAHATSHVTSSGVDLQPIFDFLDNDEDNGITATELAELTSSGDENGDGEVTAAEFQATWEALSASLNFPAEKHAQYFELVDGVDGSAEDGVIKEAENEALFANSTKTKAARSALKEF